MKTLILTIAILALSLTIKAQSSTAYKGIKSYDIISVITLCPSYQTKKSADKFKSESDSVKKLGYKSIDVYRIKGTKNLCFIYARNTKK